MKKQVLTAVALAAFALTSHATMTSSTVGNVTTYTENFDGGTSFTALTVKPSTGAIVRVAAGSTPGGYRSTDPYFGDDYLNMQAGIVGFDNHAQISFSTTEALSDVTIGLWYAYYSGNTGVEGMVSFDGTPSMSMQLLYGDIRSINPQNPGPDSGLGNAASADRYGVFAMHNVGAGVHTLDFSTCNGHLGAACGMARYKLDDLTITVTPTAEAPGITSLGAVTAVPEPETYAMLLAGLGLVGAAVRRRSREVQA